MRRVPSKIQKVDTSAIEENARKASWMRLKDNFKKLSVERKSITILLANMDINSQLD